MSRGLCNVQHEDEAAQRTLFVRATYLFWECSGVSELKIS